MYNVFLVDTKMEPSTSTSTSAFDQHVTMCESTDEESSWFEKSIGTVQEEGVHITDSPHDKLNVEFTQDELNTELTNVNESSSLNSVLMRTKLTEVIHDEEESVELISELSDKHVSNKHQELIEDLTKDDEVEEKSENVSMKDSDSSQLEDKLKEKPSSRDISDELSEMFFDVNDLNEETSKKDKLDEVLEEKLSELDSTEPPTKEICTEETVVEQESMDVDLNNSQLEISQLSTSLINSSVSENDSDQSKELEPQSMQEETSIVEESVTISEEKDDGHKHIADPKDSQPGLSPLKQLPSFDIDISDEVSENIKMNKESIELNEERMMVEFTHDDNEGRVLIQINENIKQDKVEQQNAVDAEETKEEQVQENIVAITEEANASNMNERYILQEEEFGNVEGGAEFLEAVTGDIDKLLLETTKPQPVEPVKSPPADTKLKPVSPCFIILLLFISVNVVITRSCRSIK